MVPVPGSVLLWWGLALGCFHLAHALDGAGWLILGFPFALTFSTRNLSPRVALYGGLALGLLLYAPELHFFYILFQTAAILLWLILSIWIALFLLIGRRLWGSTPVRCWWIVPFVWTGLEYFRSELYYLRFSWANSAYPLSQTPLRFLVAGWGMYFVGFVSSLAAVLWISLHGRLRMLSLLGLAILVPGLAWMRRSSLAELPPVRVAGMQLELSNPSDLPRHLDQILTQAPNAQLIVLHEYLLEGGVPTPVGNWCRIHKRWLVVGGKKELGGDLWQNTAFVVDTNGTVVLEQGKSVPIQFFKDGVAATEQRLWNSPWGKIGIAICYDLSYTRVIDRLIQSGAQALIIPTMDSIEWGDYQHRLHSMVAPIRACEHGVPIVRVASSGISQIVDSRGNVMASAPSPGNEAILEGEIRPSISGQLPLDRWLGPLSVGIVSAYLLVIGLRRIRGVKPGRGG